MIPDPADVSAGLEYGHPLAQLAQAMQRPEARKACSDHECINFLQQLGSWTGKQALTNVIGCCVLESTKVY
jgi:hypothetical protein